jgi:hypothetical protein
VVCGTGDCEDKDLVFKTLDRLLKHQIDVIIVHGGQKRRIGYRKWAGVDWWASEWARSRRKTQEIYHARWKTFKKSAGMIRNRAMMKSVGPKAYFIAVWDGKSPGTRDMIRLARKMLRHNHIRVIRYKEES